MKTLKTLLMTIAVLSLGATTPLLAQTAPSITLTPNPIPLTAGQSTNAMVQIPSPQTFGVVVNLSSSNTSSATVQASVTIPSGKLNAFFPVNGVTPGPSTITASATGYTSASAPVTFRALTVSVQTMMPPSASYGGSVSANIGPSSPLTVTLTSSNPSVASVSPATVTIPMGSTAPVNFTVTSFSVPGTTTITATDSTSSYISGSANVTIAALTVTPNPLTIAANANSTMTVTTNSVNMIPTTVNLVSSNPGALTVPPTVTINGYASFATFTVTGSATGGNSTVTASTAGQASGSASVTVTPPPALTLTPNPLTVANNSSATMTVSRSTLSTGSTTVSLVSSNPGVLSVPASVVIPASTASVSFLVTGSASASGTVTVTASSPTLASGTDSVTVTPPPGLITLTPSQLSVDHDSQATLTATLDFPTGTTTTIFLSSTNTSLVTFLSGSVDIPAGATSATFTIKTGSSGGNVSVIATSGSLRGVAAVTVTGASQGASAKIIGSSFPGAILELPSTGGGTSYVLTNLGPDATDIQLTQEGSFFSQNPASFHLDPGASQVVTVETGPLPAGFYKGFSVPNGLGVRSGFKLPIRVLVASAPTLGSPRPQPSSNRGDVSGTGIQSGSIDFTNNGDGTVKGILTSDVPWMSPQEGAVTLEPGERKTVTFTIDRAQRDDGLAAQGSDSCALTLTFLKNPAAAKLTAPGLDAAPPPPPSGISLVTIVDTTKPSVQSTSLPAIPPGQLVLFIPGVGHILGSGGKLFLSDVSVTNKNSTLSLTDLNLFYKPADKTLSASKTTSSKVDPSASLKLSDLVKTVYGQDNQIGTLQIRSTSTEGLSVGANVFNANNPKGTFGTTLPIFRSDRAAGSGERLVLTGLRKDATSHTNLYVQEGSGADASVQIEFLNAAGSVVSTMNQAVSSFGLLQISNAVPDTAVTAVITNTSGGKVFAFATPVDDISGDTWAIADWNRQFAKGANDAFVIPVVGTSRGANDTFFRTDVAITNGGTASTTATVQYFPRGAASVQKQVTIAPRASQTLNDVVGGFFGLAGDSVGFVNVIPTAGASLYVTSRTYTSAAGSAGTFGTAVPAIPAASALRAGTSKIIGGLEDANVSRVITAAPGTFRTNFGLVETSGSPATVRVSVTFSDGLQLSGGGSRASRDYALQGHGFLLVSGLVKSLLGDNRDSLYGDLHDVQVKFEIISGSGAILPFVSSTDNGTGDTVLRTE